LDVALNRLAESVQTLWDSDQLVHLFQTVLLPDPHRVVVAELGGVPAVGQQHPSTPKTRLQGLGDGR